MANDGPIPKRSEERRRRNKRTEAGEAIEPEILDAGDADVVAPDPLAHWDDEPLVVALYQSVVDSAFSTFYEPSDYEILRLTCESLYRDLRPQFVGLSETTGEAMMMRIPLKGASLSAYSKVWGELMLTEGARRRLRLEIDRNARAQEMSKTPEEVVQNRASLFAIKGGA